MTKYSIIYMFRDSHDPTLDLSQKENWDGERLVSIETDRPIGEEENIIHDWRNIMRQLAEEGQHTAISIVRFAEVVEDESTE